MGWEFFGKTYSEVKILIHGGKYNQNFLRIFVIFWRIRKGKYWIFCFAFGQPWKRVSNRKRPHSPELHVKNLSRRNCQNLHCWRVVLNFVYWIKPSWNGLSCKTAMPKPVETKNIDHLDRFEFLNLIRKKCELSHVSRRLGLRNNINRSICVSPVQRRFLRVRL